MPRSDIRSWLAFLIWMIEHLFKSIFAVEHQKVCDVIYSNCKTRNPRKILFQNVFQFFPDNCIETLFTRISLADVEHLQSFVNHSGVKERAERWEEDRGLKLKSSKVTLTQIVEDLNARGKTYSSTLKSLNC